MFQRLVDIVLAGLNHGMCLVYLDDIVVYSKTVVEHIGRLRSMFGRLREARLKLKPSKCNLLRREVGFLGQVVSGDGLATDRSKVNAVADWPVPVSVK
jgi:hypothetical protein